MKFKVSNNFFEKVPNAIFGVVIVKNFDNNKNYEFINKMLINNVNMCKEKYHDVKVKESDIVLPYREAFRKLDINPNKYMCSIEALLTRISKGNDLPAINPVVDLGNALSVKYSLPVGAHDIDNFIDNTIEIREANEFDEFVPFNSEEIEHPDINEIIYVSGNEVKTRRWTWRQGEKSKITNESKNIFFPIDGFENINKENVLALQNELVNILQKELGLEVYFGLVDKSHSEINL